MITKIYKANTSIAINVVLPNKGNMHVSFVPRSDGSSVYITDSEDVQQAIERHYKFGKLFRLESEIIDNGECAIDNVAVDRRIVKVTDIAEAKDYLAEKFGVSRTCMKGKASILAEARSHNIEFDGI